MPSPPPPDGDSCRRVRSLHGRWVWILAVPPSLWWRGGCPKTLQPPPSAHHHTTTPHPLGGGASMGSPRQAIPPGAGPGCTHHHTRSPGPGTVTRPGKGGGAKGVDTVSEAARRPNLWMTAAAGGRSSIGGVAGTVWRARAHVACAGDGGGPLEEEQLVGAVIEGDPDGVTGALAGAVGAPTAGSPVPSNDRRWWGCGPSSLGPSFPAWTGAAARRPAGAGCRIGPNRGRTP